MIDMQKIEFTKIKYKNFKIGKHNLRRFRIGADLLIGEKKFLVRYIIPAENKAFLLDNLNSLEIKHFRLFPDLDSLSKDIISELKYVGYTPPEPPVF